MGLIEDYMEANKERYEIVSNEFLKQLVDYGNKTSMEQKVRYIHLLCLHQKHFKLADSIERKYSQYFPKSDIIMAFGMAMMAVKQQHDGQKY